MDTLFSLIIGDWKQPVTLDDRYCLSAWIVTVLLSVKLLRFLFHWQYVYCMCTSMWSVDMDMVNLWMLGGVIIAFALVCLSVSVIVCGHCCSLPI